MYGPREDSFLMVRAVQGRRGKRALDMGTGSGIVARELAKGFREVWAVDINPAVRGLDWPENVRVVVSDLFERVEGRFDLIVFNPPYLPCPYEEDPELCCGDGEIIRRFLREVGKHLEEGGKVLVLVSTLTPVRVEGKVVAGEKVAFEELRVIEVRPSPEARARASRASSP